MEEIEMGHKIFVSYKYADNMFNIKKPDCAKCTNNRQIYHGESSYVLAVKWDDFIQNPEEYIDRAYKIQNSIEQYDVVKELS